MIKAKLASLNLYTDDVLSEYIMVLLQGGNGREKIFEELVIFMNSPEITGHFVLWLFGEIEKLLTVSAVGTSTSACLPTIQVAQDNVHSESVVHSDSTPIDDIQMGSGNRVHGTRNFSKALESVKSNINNPVRRTFSTDPSSYTELNDRNRREDRDSHDYRDSRDNNRRSSPQRNSNRRVVRSVAEDGGKVQKIKFSVDFDRDEQRGGRPGIRKPFKKIHVENDGNELDAEPSNPVIRVKCQYWPNCRAGDSCPNVHPSETCKNFPNCQFGDSCTFVHPSIPCKFQEKCQNPNCNYQHRPMSMMMNMAASSSNSSGNSTILCKFYPRCVNANCPFLHPVKVQCRYGVECSRPDCPFEHATGRKGAHLKSVVFAPCKYGKQCARADCPYQHTEEATTGTGALETETVSPVIPAQDQTMIQ